MAQPSASARANRAAIRACWAPRLRSGSAVDAEKAFVTAVAPASFNRGQDRYYGSDRDFLFGLADALHEEYAAIVDLLNAEGFRTATGREFNRDSVSYVARTRGWGRSSSRLSKSDT